MQTKNTCQVVEGRLMEIDVVAGYRTPADVDAMIAMIGGEFARLPATTNVVIAADWRACNVFTPEVVQKVTEMLTRTNARIERSAILHRKDHATSVLQVMRLVRETRHTSRQVFTEVIPMTRFLSEALNEAEQRRLEKFLASR